MRVPEPGDGALAIFLSRAAAEPVNQWRQRYDPSYSKIAPHITVAYPPFVPAEEWPRVRAPMLALFQRFTPFEVELSDLGEFPGEQAVLWLKPDDGGQLTELHAALAQEFPHYVGKHSLDYVPHVTLGFFDSEEALLRARDQVAAELTPMRFWVDIVVYISLGAGGWNVVDPLPLGRPAA